MTPTRQAEAANGPSRLVTWLALLAFLLQGLIAQTHVHITELKAAVPVQQNHQPDQKAPADCPACQLYAATAAALTPDGAVILLPLSFVATATTLFHAFTATGNPHQGWQSRAPPRA